MQTLSWTELQGIGLLGFGATAPASGTLCLIAHDRSNGVRQVEVARFVRRGLIGRFERKDGSRCSLWSVDGWMDAKPIADFIRGGKDPTATLYV